MDSFVAQQDLEQLEKLLCLRDAECRHAHAMLNTMACESDHELERLRTELVESRLQQKLIQRENELLRHKLETFGVELQVMSDCRPVQIARTEHIHNRDSFVTQHSNEDRELAAARLVQLEQQLLQAAGAFHELELELETAQQTIAEMQQEGVEWRKEKAETLRRLQRLEDERALYLNSAQESDILHELGPLAERKGIAADERRDRLLLEAQAMAALMQCGYQRSHYHAIVTLEVANKKIHHLEDVLDRERREAEGTIRCRVDVAVANARQQFEAVRLELDRRVRDAESFAKSAQTRVATALDAQAQWKRLCDEKDREMVAKVIEKEQELGKKFAARDEHVQRLTTELASVKKHLQSAMDAKSECEAQLRHIQTKWNVLLEKQEQQRRDQRDEATQVQVHELRSLTQAPTQWEQESVVRYWLDSAASSAPSSSPQDEEEAAEGSTVNRLGVLARMIGEPLLSRLVTSHALFASIDAMLTDLRKKLQAAEAESIEATTALRHLEAAFDVRVQREVLHAESRIRSLEEEVSAQNKKMENAMSVIAALEGERDVVQRTHQRQRDLLHEAIEARDAAVCECAQLRLAHKELVHQLAVELETSAHRFNSLNDSEERCRDTTEALVALSQRLEMVEVERDVLLHDRLFGLERLRRQQIHSAWAQLQRRWVHTMAQLNGDWTSGSSASSLSDIEADHVESDLEPLPPPMTNKISNDDAVLPLLAAAASEQSSSRSSECDEEDEGSTDDERVD